MKKYSKLMAVLLVVAMLLPGIAQAAPVAEQAKVMRVAGESRVGTSIKVSEVAMKTAKEAVLVGYSGEADALTGGILAKAKDAPLFFVRASEVEAVKARLDKLGVEKVHVLGGTTVFTEKLMNEFNDYAPKRITGDNRYQTAINAAKVAVGDKADTVFLAKGNETLADALSIGAISAKENTPLLLTHGKNLTEVTKQALKDMEVKKIEMIGGKSAVSEEIKNELEKLGYTVNRTAGDNRQATSVEIAKKFNPEAKEIVIANGFDYADAVTAGYFAAGRDAVVLLTNQNLVHPSVKEFLEDNKLDTTVLGGTSAIAKGTFDKIVEYLDGVVVEMPEEEEPTKELAIESVSAINANTLKTTFNMAADVEDVKLAVTRGTTAVAGTFKWSEENKVATFTADGKLLKGTYTVTATSKADEAFKATGTVEVNDQKVTEIIIENDVALTGESKDSAGKDVRNLAYAFYDVVDQYGESVRGTTNIQWTASVSGAKGNRTTGEIVLTSDKELMYGEKIYLTGVDAKNGVSVQKELTVGQPRALNSLEVAGFVKKGTSTIVTELPAGFKVGAYSMVFQALDQNGNLYPADKVSSDDVTFISDNPLLIEKVSDTLTQLVIDGIDYKAAAITPGMNVDKGGEVNITAIAKKTGKQTVKNIVVGDVAILSSFEMLSPTGIIAEGETIEIPFEAKAGDQKITNFTTLAKKSGINELKLNQPSTGSLVLRENNDGTAKLVYIPETKIDDNIVLGTPWTVSETTDGIDRPVSLTTVVVGGNASNIMLSVADKAMPVGIKEVDFDNTLVENGSTTITLSSDKKANDFTFVDQYGRVMDEVDAYNFFDAAEKGQFKSGQELQGYKYSIQATYKGEEKVFIEGGSKAVKNTNTFEIKATDAKKSLALKTIAVDNKTKDTDITGTAKTNMSLDFEIIRYKADQTFGSENFDYTPVSSKKNIPLTVVDITAVKNFEVKELEKIFVQTQNSNKPTGATVATIAADLAKGMTTEANGETTLQVTGEKALKTTNRVVEVIADYNGNSVVVPKEYLEVGSNQVFVDSTSKKIMNVKNYEAAEAAEAAVEAKDAVAAKATVGGVDFEAVTPGVAGNSITVTIVQGVAEAGTPATESIVVSTNDITINLAATWDAALNSGAGGSVPTVMTVAELKTLISESDTAKNLIKVTSETGNVSAATKTSLTGGENEITAKDAKLAKAQQGFKWGDFYDAKTANFLRKDAKATVTAKVYDGKGKGVANMINTANRTVLLSDATPVATTIVGPETLTVKPGETKITVADIRAAATLATEGIYKVKDQYGEDFTANINYKAINVEENKDGYVNNNFKITKNDTNELTITGAERGDTFTLELAAGSAKLIVKATVGADSQAYVSGTNYYIEDLVGENGALELQRQASLK